MDEIEAGFTKLAEKINEMSEKTDDALKTIKENDAVLMEKMAGMALPVIQSIGLNMLEKGKQQGGGELYDTSFYPQKMIVLGKTDPVKFRLDDVSKKVDDQFCLLSEDGHYYEIMYSSDGFLVDSYLHLLTAQEVLDLYGYEIMFMLYRALKDYLKNQEVLLEALEKTINFIFAKEE
ncbi:MAG: hypothetical protein MUF37_04195 [Methanoregulaceae archaeon]|jgi:hypothetical protein|nr:hypothetical protein [Methanoregulaceae archaeon]